MTVMESNTLTRKEILEYIGANRDRFKREFHVRRIALIGSFARNEQTVDSDVDLLVDIEENAPDLYSLKRNLRRAFESQFGRAVDIASERYLKPYYREEILSEAIYV